MEDGAGDWQVMQAADGADEENHWAASSQSRNQTQNVDVIMSAYKQHAVQAAPR